jgi:hypothetical protein
MGLWSYGCTFLVFGTMGTKGQLHSLSDYPSGNISRGGSQRRSNAREKKIISSLARNRIRVMQNNIGSRATVQILFNKETQGSHENSEVRLCRKTASVV